MARTNYEVNRQKTRVPMPELDPVERAQTFDEVALGYSEEEAVAEARRCIQCPNAPCVGGCPVGVPIPQFIAQVAEGNFARAYAIVKSANSLPAICGRVCPQETQCEGVCTRGKNGEPVSIGRLERFTSDWAFEHPEEAAAAMEEFACEGEGLVEQTAGDDAAASIDLSGKRVAVVGSGPASLTCAGELAKLGCDVTVFEALHKVGGVLTYGIPEFRLPKDLVQREVSKLGDKGVSFEVNALVGKLYDIDELMEDRGFDAVFVGTGAGLPSYLGIEGEGLNGVSVASELLTRVNLMKAYLFPEYETPVYAGKKCVVVGGGNVAMDCARTSVRAGADEVSVVYRRRKDDMTALPAEVESAIAEGVEMIVLEAPVSIEADERGHCTALITQPQMIGPVRGGRPAPVAADKPTRRIEADVILIAVGQNVVSGPFEEFGMQTTWGCFNADEHLAAEGHDHVFVGGDCQTGPSTVIRAIGAGKVAARNIDEFLGYHHKLPCGIEVPEPLPNDRTPKGRVEITERPARERRLDFDGVENGMSREEVVQECGRCLRCDRFGCGVMEGGRHQYA